MKLASEGLSAVLNDWFATDDILYTSDVADVSKHVNRDHCIHVGTFRGQIRNRNTKGRRIYINKPRHATGRMDRLEHDGAAIEWDSNASPGPQLERLNREDNPGSG